MSGFTTPLSLAVDRRRLAYCVAGALALHLSGVVSHWVKWKPAPAPVEEPEPLIVPVALDDPPPLPPPPAPPPAPEPPPPPPPAAEPPPAPVEKAPDRPKPLAARVPAPEVAPAPEAKPAEDASAFVGKHGAFSAKVCFLPRDTRSVQALEGCKPVSKFSTNELNVSQRRFRRGFPGVEKRVDWFGIEYQGRFKVRAGGYYTFRLLSDDGAVLFIDGHQVLDNDGQHSVREAKIALPLAQGEHDFRLLYYQGPASSLALQLFVKAYKKPERLFGPDL